MELKCIIDRFEEDKAILATEGGEEIIFPKNLLPEAREGAVLNFQILTSDEEEDKKRKKAKDILNEILNTGEEEKN